MKGPGVIFRRDHAPLQADVEIADWTVFGMDDIFLDYAGRRPSEHPIHHAISGLSAGSPVRFEWAEGGIGIFTTAGTQVGRLSERAAGEWRDKIRSIRGAHVLGLFVRRAADVTEPDYGKRLTCERWETPWIEIRHAP